VSRSVCMVSMPEAAAPRERTDMMCSYLGVEVFVR
jgi:hypothetical protein